MFVKRVGNTEPEVSPEPPNWASSKARGVTLRVRPETQEPLPRQGFNGGDDGNRTRVASLEDWSFTIKLHPHNSESYAVQKHLDQHSGKAW